MLPLPSLTSLCLQEEGRVPTLPEEELQMGQCLRQPALTSALLLQTILEMKVQRTVIRGRSLYLVVQGVPEVEHRHRQPVRFSTLFQALLRQTLSWSSQLTMPYVCLLQEDAALYVEGAEEVIQQATLQPSLPQSRKLLHHPYQLHWIA